MKTVWLCALVAVLAFVSSISPPARGGGTRSELVWTTTADFDAGNKSDPGDEFFASNGADQPMYSMISNPSAMYVDGRTYVVWQGGRGMDPFITYYDHEAGEWAENQQVGDCWQVQDGHGAPALWVASDGYIHVSACSHATSEEYWRSVEPYDITAWENMSSAIVGGFTYPNLWEYGGKLWKMYRGPGGGNDPWRIVNSTDGGDTWSLGESVLDFSGGAGDGAYFGGSYALSGDKIYFAFYRVSTVRDDVYAFYIDLDTRHVFDVSGVNDLGYTISSTEAETYLEVYNTAYGAAAMPVVHLNSVGNPYLMYGEQKVSGTDPLSYINFTRWAGSSWSAPVEITETDSGSNYMDFIIHGDSDVEAFVTGSGVDHLPNLDEHSGDMERWSWQGSTWRQRETIMLETEAGGPVALPEVPLNYDDDIRLVFAERGGTTVGGHEYIEDPWDLKLYAWGQHGFAHRTDSPSGNPGVETSTDNDWVADGEFRLTSTWNGSWEDDDPNADTWKWNWKTFDGGGSTTPVIQINERRIEDHTFVLNITTNGPGGSTGIASAWYVLGDFDFWTKIHLVSHEGAGSYNPGIFVNDRPEVTCYGSVMDGAWYRAIYNWLLQAFKCVDGVLTLIGDTTDLGGFHDVCLRIVRSGYIYFYYSTEPDCTNWVLDESYNPVGLSQYVWPSMSGSAVPGVGDTTTEWVFSNFSISENQWEFMKWRGGDRSAYRPINDGGSWQTETFEYAGEVVQVIEVDYDEVGTDEFIDSVAVVDADGDVLYVNDTDVKTGSTVAYTIPEEDQSALAGKDWAVRVALVGSMLWTAEVEEVRVTTGEPPAMPPPEEGGGLPGLDTSRFFRCSYLWLERLFSCTSTYRPPVPWNYSSLPTWELSLGGVRLSHADGLSAITPVQLPTGYWPGVTAKEYEMRVYVPLSSEAYGEARVLQFSFEAVGDDWPWAFVYAALVALAIALAARGAGRSGPRVPRGFERRAVRTEARRGWTVYWLEEPANYANVRWEPMPGGGARALGVSDRGRAKVIGVRVRSGGA